MLYTTVKQITIFIFVYGLLLLDVSDHCLNLLGRCLYFGLYLAPNVVSRRPFKNRQRMPADMLACSDRSQLYRLYKSLAIAIAFFVFIVDGVWSISCKESLCNSLSS